jgi:ComF family protein
MNAFLSDLTDFIYPPVCCVCRTDIERSDTWSICQRCRDQIAYIQPPFFARCGRAYAHEQDFEHLCGDCISGARYYRRARSVGHYSGTLRNALHLFKYRLQRHLAKTLGGIMTGRLSSLAEEWRYDIIMPVPLHPRRLRTRGFNQALCLASALGRHLRVPLDRFNLKRLRWTTSQVGLTERERKLNVRNAFAVCRPEAVRDKFVLLIDDIYTSGSTVNECSRVLITAGTEAVDVLTLARVA